MDLSSDRTRFKSCFATNYGICAVIYLHWLSAPLSRMVRGEVRVNRLCLQRAPRGAWHNGWARMVLALKFYISFSRANFESSNQKKHLRCSWAGHLLLLSSPHVHHKRSTDAPVFPMANTHQCSALSLLDSRWLSLYNLVLMTQILNTAPWRQSCLNDWILSWGFLMVVGPSGLSLCPVALTWGHFAPLAFSFVLYPPSSKPPPFYLGSLGNGKQEWI